MSAFWSPSKIGLVFGFPNWHSVGIGLVLVWKFSESGITIHYVYPCLDRPLSWQDRTARRHAHCHAYCLSPVCTSLLSWCMWLRRRVVVVAAGGLLVDRQSAGPPLQIQVDRQSAGRGSEHCGSEPEPSKTGRLRLRKRINCGTMFNWILTEKYKITRQTSRFPANVYHH